MNYLSVLFREGQSVLAEIVLKRTIIVSSHCNNKRITVLTDTMLNFSGFVYLETIMFGAISLKELL